MTVRATATTMLRATARWLGRAHMLWPGRSGETPLAPPAASAIRRILWIRLDHIGDVVMSLPTLRALHDGLPQARIDVLVRPGVAPLLEDLPDLDRVFSYDTPRFPERGRGAGLFRAVALLRRLRRRHYDLALELRGDDIGRLLALLAGARWRVGPERIFYEAPGSPNFSFLLTHPVALPETPRHAVLNNLALLEPLGLNGPPKLLRFPVPEARRAAVAARLRALAPGLPSRFAAVHAASNDPSRNWLPDRFARVIDHLVDAHNLDVVLTGAARDAAYNALILEQVARPARVHNAAGCFGLAELPAFFERAALLVTVDTGPVHIAAAAGIPIVALFLPRLVPFHHPYGQLDGVVQPESDMPAVAQPSWSSVQRDSLEDITVAAVVRAIDRKLAGA